MQARLIHRLRTSLTTLPTGRGWLLTLAIGAAALAMELAIGLTGGFLTPSPPDWPALPGALLLAIFIPAIGEELVFRGLLVPGREERSNATAAILLSTAVFVGWHVLEGLTFMRFAAPIFLRPDFLLTTAVLGLACGVLRHRTGSLWPAVLLHWLEVAGWRIWFDGGGFGGGGFGGG